MDKLDEVDWPLLRTRNFARNPDDPAQIERYQAEALIHGQVPLGALVGIVVYTDQVKARIEQDLAQLGLKLNVLVRRPWYF